MKIVLASTSKFKSDILSRVHIKHECMGIDYEENSNQSNYVDYVKELALGKAECLRDKVDGIIIGIDNVVVCIPAFKKKFQTQKVLYLLCIFYNDFWRRHGSVVYDMHTAFAH